MVNTYIHDHILPQEIGSVAPLRRRRWGTARHSCTTSAPRRCQPTSTTTSARSPNHFRIQVDKTKTKLNIVKHFHSSGFSDRSDIDMYQRSDNPTPSDMYQLESPSPSQPPRNRSSPSFYEELTREEDTRHEVTSIRSVSVRLPPKPQFQFVQDNQVCFIHCAKNEFSNFFYCGKVFSVNGFASVHRGFDHCTIL